MAFGTLGMALVIWFGDVGRRWEDSLPKRLSVRFSCEGRVVMECRMVYLAGEGDIRAWGQQLGMQMTGGREQLRFSPHIRQEPGRVVVRENNETVKEYRVCFELIELPGRIRRIQNQEETGTLPLICFHPMTSYVPW